jgi:hypothetical protein
MAAAADFTFQGLTWGTSETADRSREDRNWARQSLRWLGVLMVAGLASVLPAGSSDEPGRVASSSSDSGMTELSLPLRATISRLAGAATPGYAAQGTGGNAVLHNTRHGLSARFSASGASIQTLGESANLRLRSYGYGGALQSVTATRPTYHANVVTYPRATVTERYTNGPLGIEQEFVLARRPSAQSGEALTVALALSGTLTPRLSADGRVLAFHSNDRLVLQYSGLFAVDASGRQLRSSLVLRRSTLTIRVDDRGARYPVTIDPFFQQAKVTASDGAANDFFGLSVAVSGDTAVVGSYRSDVAGMVDRGAAYVFVRPASGWSGALTETAKLTASDGASADWLGYSVSIDGDTIAVGAPQAAGKGAVYVFKRPASGWAGTLTETAKFTTSNSDSFQQLGQSVALSGNAVVSAAPEADVAGNTSQGAAFVFVRSAGGWSSGTESAKLLASDGVAGDSLGYAAGDHSVAISDDTVVVGSGFKNNFQGAAYVWVRPASGWSGTLLSNAKVVASDGEPNDNLGFGVAVDHGTIVVGAGRNGGGGGAYVYQRPPSGWSGEISETAKLTPSGAVNDDFFGRAVGISGDTVFVGGPFAAAVYVKQATGWITAAETQALAAPVELPFGGFADFLGIADRTIIAGTPLLSVNGKAQQGAAYIFGSEAFSPVDTLAPQATNLRATPNPALVSAQVTVRAAIEDTATGGSAIASADLQVNGGAWTPMQASDGAFDEQTENVQATLGTFASADAAEVCMRGRDVAGNTSAPVCILLPMVDPSAGFVTGAGSIASRTLACPVSCRGAAGGAHVVLVARYQNRASVPIGETDFRFQAGDLRFKSTSYEWLIVNGDSGIAQYKGTGQLNGRSGYSFWLTVYDAAVTGVGTDGVRMKVAGPNGVIYDNRPGISDANASSSSTQPISRGNIVIHARK